MFNMIFDIQVGKYKLGLLSSAEVRKSVDLIASTCTVVLPGTAYNRTLNIEDKIQRGDKVTVKFGYDDLTNAKPEFEGYLQSISTDNGSITLECEDAIYLIRKSIKDKAYGKVSIKDIAANVVKETNSELLLVCDYDIRYDKFVISRATGFDVLKKLKDETAANIYVRGNELHIHPPYIEKFGAVKYDFARNIENSELRYRLAEDRKYEVEVEGMDAAGKRISVKVGDSGGDKRSIKRLNIFDKAVLKKIGEEELKKITFDGYEGSITTWLIPYVEPGYSAIIHDADYEYKNGWYYVVSVTTTFSEQGGVRKVELGIKLGNNE